jgi:hypothetical protein
MAVEPNKTLSYAWGAYGLEAAYCMFSGGPIVAS